MMYKPYKHHMQPRLINNVSDLPENKHKRQENSWTEDFYHYFFSRIDEEAFAVLYSDHPSQPNVPINWLIGLETLKAGFGWSDEEPYNLLYFDLQVRYALSIHDLNESDFDLRTLYYFCERLCCYNLELGMNLLTRAFEDITDQQLTTLQVKAGKQRMDSTQIARNFLDMSRFQLLIEAIKRLHCSLSEGNQQRYTESFTTYLQSHLGQYLHRIKGKEATKTHLQQIGEVIILLLEVLQDGHTQDPAYLVLRRFFKDNFCLEDQAVHPKANQEL